LEIDEQVVREVPDAPDGRHNLAQCHINLGNVLNRMGRQEEARHYLEQALLIQKELVSQFPSVPAYRVTLAINHRALSSLGFDQEKREYLKAELDIRTQLATDFPEVPEYTRCLIWTHYDIGNICREAGMPSEARQNYEKAFEAAKKLAARFPNVREYQDMWVNTYYSLGSLLHTLGQSELACAHVEKALPILQQQVRDFPDVPAHRVALGGAYCNLGLYLSRMRKNEEALPYFAQAQETLEYVLDRFPTDADAKAFLLNVFSHRAAAFTRLNRFSEAIPDWERAIKLSEPKEDPFYQVGLAGSLMHTGDTARGMKLMMEWAQHPNITADALYNGANFFAMATTDSGNDADLTEKLASQAVAFLRQVKEMGGFADEELVAELKKENPGFQSIRQRTDFQELLAQIESESQVPAETMSKKEHDR
jgi:tetratricopeptide (TPR) repeat protein